MLTSQLLADGAQTIAQYIGKYGSMENGRDFGGVVPAYPIFMLIGIIVVIVLSIIKMRMKDVPLQELYWAIFIIVPIGVFGGSIFGKAFTPGITWYKVFFFWEPGMSLFGAVGLGTITGFIWFYMRSKVTFISVWVYADCILPNILLGQAIGRWGNFYNHELLGNAVSYESLQWLAPSIRDNCFYFPLDDLAKLNLAPGWENYVAPLLAQNPNLQITADMVSIKDAAGNIIYGPNSTQLATLNEILHRQVQYQEPLFLYESMANCFYWLILTFLVPNLSRFFQAKGKYPWDIDPKAYPGWFNKKYKSLPEAQITSTRVQRPIKYKQVMVETENGQQVELRMGLFKAWDKAYYLYEPNQEVLDTFVARSDKRVENETIIKDKLKVLEEKNKNTLSRYDENFARKTRNLPKQHHTYVENKLQLNELKKQQEHIYKSERNELLQAKHNIRSLFRPNPDAKELTEINNPNKYWILRSGVLSGAYVAGYMIIRIVLETHRRVQDYFVQGHPIPDYIVLSILLVIGIFMIVLTQFVAPYKWREVGWLYEKSY